MIGDDIFRWEVIIIGPPETAYEGFVYYRSAFLFLGGYFKARLTFPKDYPMKPPKLTFISKMWHPNVHSNGDVCISILHEPGDDKYGYEKASERWLPIHTVEVKQPLFRTNRVFFQDNSHLCDFNAR